LLLKPPLSCQLFCARRCACGGSTKCNFILRLSAQGELDGIKRHLFLSAISEGNLCGIRLRLLQICGAQFQKFSSVKGIRKQRFWRDLDGSSPVCVVTSNLLVQVPVPPLVAPGSQSTDPRSEGVFQVIVPGSSSPCVNSGAILSVTSNVLVQVPVPPLVAPPFPSSLLFSS